MFDRSGAPPPVVKVAPSAKEMTLRDHFAGLAMQAYLSRRDCAVIDAAWDVVSGSDPYGDSAKALSAVGQQTYAIAAAMLKAREEA